MGQDKSGSGLPFNWTSLLALLTVVGGLVLVSKRVTSDRPSTTVEATFQSVGDQRLDARLWEDPLGWKTNQAQASGAEAFRRLRQQIGAYSTGTNAPMLMPVMVHGGPYSEDQEKRIRCRFAIISALGESGYAPEDADHIGAINIPWPATEDMETGWLTNSASGLQLQLETNSRGSNQGFLPCSSSLRIGFEWYRSRDFYGGGSPSPKYVLVLWLDENTFADYPPIRLALLLSQLTVAVHSPEAGGDVCSRVKLIGPRSSAILRALLPPYGTTNFDSSLGSALQAKVRQALQSVDVYCATASAMDEVLEAGSSNAPPRQLVARALTNFWFRSFNNFSCTDAQLAREALAELALRDIDLRGPACKNLVLISEWDTFFGRMLSLTYAAELAKYQDSNAFPSALAFVTHYRTNQSVWPTNLFSFVYLRGLDGQTTKPTAPAATGSDRLPPPSLEDLKQGNAGQNKAEGQSQFDYLTRLGDRMQTMENHLIRQRRGRFDAIGIVGSDDYDTLVILEALRDKFPDAVFFTTDLDARLTHPTEQKWARNLVVLSSYGFQLTEGLQRSVTPFRDSEQTAEFAATLAALGNASLIGLTNISPRRFEIGRAQAFDLSVNDDFPHPKPLAKTGFVWSAKSILGGVLALLAGGLLLSLIWRTLGRLTWDHNQFETERLWLKEEDLGGLPGFMLLYENLRASDDEFGRWLFNTFSATTNVQPPPSASEKTMRRFLDFLNQRILQDNLPAEKIAASKILSAPTREAFVELLREKQSRGVFLAKNSQGRLRLHVRIVDELINELLLADEIGAGVHGAGQAGRHAREAGLELFRFRRFRRWGIWLGLPALVAMFALLWAIALNDNRHGSGEPLLLLAGISVWPTEILRLAVAALAIVFLLNSYAQLRTGILDITQRYRLPLLRQRAAWLWRLPSTPPPQASVDAVKLWEHYQQLGWFWARVRRMVCPLLFYLLFAVGIALQFGHMPYSPVRGHLCSFLDHVLLGAAVLTYLFLTFWLIDAARLCRWLIEYLSESPTEYPLSTLDYFAEQRGLKTHGNPGETGAVEEQTQILSEWIDLQLIAELTERIGRLVYYPFILFFILLVSRNNWWAHWTWPPGLVFVFTLNLVLAGMSILILQKAALRARAICVEKLRTKVEKAEQNSAPTPSVNRAERGRKLLQEIEDLQTGAFAPFWQNPVIGAVLIPSGGSVLLELLNNLFR